MIEICLQNIDDILLVNKYKDIVSRIELNSALELGGLTPSINLLKEVRKMTDIKIISMLRPRGGDFVYSDLEFKLIIKQFKSIIKYCDGVAFGALNEDGQIDIKKTKKIISLCKKYNKEFVFHRAVDETKNYISSIKKIDELGATRILTSGHEDNIELGFENIKNIKTNCEILLGCGINSKNFKNFGNYQIHGTFSIFTTYKKLNEKDLIILKKSL